jgi:hydrogenase maturation protein HypF
MLDNRLNTPITSSAGRLFDAIASIIGLQQYTQFEGQAAMALEFAIETLETDAFYPFEVQSSRFPASSKKSEILNRSMPIIIDWGVMIKTIVADHYSGLAISTISTKFHNTLVEMIVAIAKHIGEKRVVLTGGCFQNNYLTERAIWRLRAEGFRPYRHQRIPSNDGGIALGQIMAALREHPGDY